MWVQDEAEAFRGEKFFVDLLKREPGDKRLATYFSPNADGEFFGFAVHNPSLYSSAVNDNETDVATCVRMKKYSTYAENFPLIRYEENVLIKAECEARGSKVADAVTDVNIIRVQNGLPAFSGTDPIAVAKEVLTQKFLELYLEGQAWHDMRRTGTLPETVTSTTQTNLRFIYGESEKNANPKVPQDAISLCKWVLNTKYGGMLP